MEERTFDVVGFWEEQGRSGKDEHLERTYRRTNGFLLIPYGIPHWIPHEYDIVNAITGRNPRVHYSSQKGDMRQQVLESSIGRRMKTHQVLIFSLESPCSSRRLARIRFENNDRLMKRRCLQNRHRTSEKNVQGIAASSQQNLEECCQGEKRSPRGPSALVDAPWRLRRRMNIELNFPPNFEGLVLGCTDANFCK